MTQYEKYAREYSDCRRRMNDPTGSSFVTGLCGDEMEFYLYIRNRTIEEAVYETNGCDVTQACGAWVAQAVTGRNVEDALAVSPKQVLDALPDIPVPHRHCPILAVTAFFQAVADFMQIGRASCRERVYTKV